MLLALETIISKINVIRLTDNDHKLDLPYNLLDVKFPYNITKDVIDKLLNKNVDNAPPVMMYS